jgi:hypothetical protein
MFTQVAVVPLDPDEEVRLDVLLPIAAAIQVQVQRDLGPHWGLQAAVSAFPSLEDVPQGTWPVAVTKRTALPVDGFHFVMNGLPFGIVGYGEKLSVVLSHEIAEMLVDPHGDHAIAGPGLTANAGADTATGEVPTFDYIVEVCDVCEGVTYRINGVDVADFVVPGYYDMDNSRSRGYSFTGTVSAPRQVRKGGYLTWREPFPSTTVYQAFALAGAIPDFVQELTAGELTTVTNPGAKDVNRQHGQLEVPEELRVLPLPNSPTRAWRELIAELARQDTDKPASKNQGPTRGDDFASNFRDNINALLTAMRHKQRPPSIPEILDLVENAAAPQALGQAPQTDAYAKQRKRIIDWLRRQQTDPQVLGQPLDPGQSMWMFMIMP